MKILVGNLLFATALFINYREINSTGGTVTIGKNTIYLPTPYVPYAYTQFKFTTKAGDWWVQVNGVMQGHDAFDQVKCFLLGRDNYIPTSEDKKQVNFKAIAVFSDSIKCVAYILGDDNVLGVRTPYLGYVSTDRRSEPMYLLPDVNNWYLNYMNNYYEIFTHPGGSPKDILLHPKDRVRASAKRLSNVSPMDMQYGDLHFTVWIKTGGKENGKIVGAFLKQHAETSGSQHPGGSSHS